MVADLAWGAGAGLGLGLGLAALGVAQLVPPLVNWWRAARYRQPPPAAWPAVHLVVPCKGGGALMRRQLAALAAQSYRPLVLSFVTESEGDAAVPLIRALAAAHGHVRHLVAGLAHTGSQKIHNLLAAVAAAPPETEVFAFCDADIEPRPELLHNLVGALVGRGATVATGYRWLAPRRAGLGARLHAVLSGYLATLIAWPGSRVVWGGTWAIRRRDWERLGVAGYWRRRLSDDLSLQTLLERDRARREFVPTCVSRTGEAISRLPDLIDWFSRQVFYTRLYTPRWWAVSVVGLIVLGAAVVAAVVAVGLALAGGPGGTAGPWAAAGGTVLLLAVLITPALVAAPRRRLLTFPLLWWVGLAPLTGAVALISALRSIFMRRVTWADITYTFNRDGTVRDVFHGAGHGRNADVREEQ